MEDVLHLSSLFPKLHLALCDWMGSADKTHLIEYGLDFSHALEVYALQNFEALAQATDTPPTLKQVLDHWKKVSEVHTRREFFEMQPAILIHGDTNYTNIHIHKTDPQRFKVVDWEWAGFAPVFADLVSLMKGSPEKVEGTAIQNYLSANGGNDTIINPRRSFHENQRLYTWCKLERGMLDASFLAAQFLNSEHKANFNLNKAVTVALDRVLATTQQLS
jgi:thiamine kinase-like enzyme